MARAVAPRVLVVKLSSLGDVVHTLPVVADVLAAHPGATVDWVVEPAFAPIVRRVRGIGEAIECPLRRWRRALAAPATWREIAAFVRRLRRERYDAILDLQGLTKSALVARLARVSRGRRYGLANRTEGSSHERPAVWLADVPVAVTPRSHAVDRGRELVRKALGTDDAPRPDFGLGRAGAVPPGARPTVAFVHGTTRADKLWPEDRWIALGRRLAAAGVDVALPSGNEEESARAVRLAVDIGPTAHAWPRMPLDAVVDRLVATAGAIGVDSGPSHVAVALDLPHVQIYNLPTAWRTGPQERGGATRQVAVLGDAADPVPGVDAVWAAWERVAGASGRPVADGVEPMSATPAASAASASPPSSASGA